MLPDLRRTLPVVAQADVVICGGGPAGVGAAVAAARMGKSALILEQTGCLGGLGTSGMVPVFCPATDGEKIIARGVCQEVMDEVARRMDVPVSYDWFPYHYETLKRVYDDIVLAAGARILFFTTLADVICSDGHVEAVVVATREGLRAIRGTVFVDATGDGNLCAWAGAPYEVGGENGELMGPTLCSSFSGVDWGAYHRSCSEGNDARSIWLRMMAEGTAPLPEWHFVGAFKAGEGLSANNLGHVYGVNGLSEESLTQGMIDGRKTLEVYLDFYRRHVPGFEKAEMAWTGSLLGVRETRRITGDYVLNYGDYKNRARFDDEIARFAYPVDIHSATTDPAAQKKVEEELMASRLGPGESYGIPYRSLIPRNLTNVLVAGRCLSADRALQSSTRVMPCCLVTGQATGMAASLASDGDVRAVDAGPLRQALREQNAYLPGE
jgi:hypothetical protein